jgi:hypothetical protein
MTPVPDPRYVWVVHGRNRAARDALFEFLRAIGLEPIEWNKAIAWCEDGAVHIGKVLDRAFTLAHAVVVLLTGDDMSYLRPQFALANDPPMETTPTPQARPNVLFEAGMALGRKPKRTVLVTLGVLRSFSDVAGMLTIPLSDLVSDRQNLADRLKAIGCAVEIQHGTDWHHAGSFDTALKNSEEEKLPTSGSGYHYLIARNTGKVLDVTLAPYNIRFFDVGNLCVHQVDHLGLQNQHWHPVQNTDGYYFLFVKHSGKCLDVEAGKTNDKARVIEYQFNGSDAQKWKLINAGGGHFFVINKGSGKALHAEEGSDAIYQFTFDRSNSQKWKFHPA